MSSVLLAALTVLIATLCVLVGFFAVQIFGAVLSATEEPTGQDDDEGSSARIAVVVPAHNESDGIVLTLSDILPQLRYGDRLIVVADNCSDDTADVSARAGAEVISRNDTSRIGKGYALGRGIEHLDQDPPDFVLFVDADCRVDKGAVIRLLGASERYGRPIQAAFLMTSPPQSPIDHSLAEFAWRVKNWVRPLGLKVLNFPVQLTGSGMMFPWALIRAAPLASGNLVEDLKLGLDLARQGKAPAFLPTAKVRSYFPNSEGGSNSQRQRWIQGHLSMIARTAPPLLWEAITKRNRDLFILTLDLLIPPFLLLALLVAIGFVLSIVAAWLGMSAVPAVGALVALVTLSAALFAAWQKFGRDVLPASVLASKLPLLLRKLVAIGRILMGRKATQWIRTDRSVPREPD